MPKAGNTPTMDEQTLWTALQGIPDPEIPVVSIVEMGIVRSVQLQGLNATIGITPTFSACPALHVIQASVIQAIQSLGLTVILHTVLAPPWSTDWITPAAKEKLRLYGIAPPLLTSELIQLEPALPCPRCQSLDTTLKNTFGPTLCKQIRYCNRCQEPFESFKTI
jgi:ring-1,2-phenylacetyl-CoA epoxidase subunit PaaD